MFKSTLFVLIVVCVTMVLSRPGGYGGVQESKPVYGGSGSSYGNAGSSNYDSFGKPGQSGHGIRDDVRDHNDYQRNQHGHDSHSSQQHHAPGAYDNDNHRRGGSDYNQRRGNSDRYDDSHSSQQHHAPGAYDNDNHRRGGSDDRHHAPGAYDNDRRGSSNNNYERRGGNQGGSYGGSYGGGKY